MRLLTRSDFDGLICGALLKEAGVVDTWKFVHPKDIQDGLVAVDANDVLANIPYVEGCGLWFDHHSSEDLRLKGDLQFEGDSRPAPSCARIIFEYYGGADRFPQFADMMGYVDKVDSGQLTKEEILHPEGWILLGFIMDPRTGLGRFRQFAISNYQLMEKLMDDCRHMAIADILAEPDVKERIDLYWEQDDLYRDMIKEHTVLDGNVIVTDLRNVDTIYTGNRFLLYSLYPEQNISVWVIDGRQKLNCVFAVGHSILNRTSNTDVGSLLLQYGGGGHKQVGTCQVPYEESNRVLGELVGRMKQDG